MAKFNETYYTGKDQYSDGDIEDTILEIAKSGRSLYELEQDEATFPVVYHMSHIRQNIFTLLKKMQAFLRSVLVAALSQESYVRRLSRLLLWNYLRREPQLITREISYMIILRLW